LLLQHKLGNCKKGTVLEQVCRHAVLER